tara:strand:+ start:1212 stop:1679 length:468 start_codon:yes stop_codon:yes gene_type:complete
MIQSRQQLKISRALLRLGMLSHFREAPSVEIPVIPRQRELFPGTSDDYWSLLETSAIEDMTSCLYEVTPGGVFPTHSHEKSTETIKVITAGSKVEIVTELDIYFLGFGEEITIPCGMKHALVNLSNFPLKIQVDWRPKMKGWNGLFNVKKAQATV